MSIKIMSRIWEDGPDQQSELLVLLALADWANDDGDCWPSMAGIARKARIEERSARRIVRRLEESGWLWVNVNGGRHGCNNYRINPDPKSPGLKVPRTETTQNPDPPVPPPRTPRSPEPSITIIKPSEKKEPRKPEMPIPENWVPSDRNLEDAAERNFSAKEIEDEADRFRNYHLSRDTRFRDWDAAWRTWLGNARKFAPVRVAGTTQAGGRGQGSSIASIAARRHLGG